MKKMLLLNVLLFMIPIVASASWQLANPSHSVTGVDNNNVVAYPKRYQAKMTAKVIKGNLVDNVKRIAHNNGWQVIWQAKTTYVVLWSTTITGANIVEVLNQLLCHYPLTAAYRFNFRNQQPTIIVTKAPLLTSTVKRKNYK